MIFSNVENVENVQNGTILQCQFSSTPISYLTDRKLKLNTHRSVMPKAIAAEGNCSKGIAAIE